MTQTTTEQDQRFAVTVSKLYKDRFVKDDHFSLNSAGMSVLRSQLEWPYWMRVTDFANDRDTYYSLHDSCPIKKVVVERKE